MNTLLLSKKDKQSTKRWKLGALSLLSAMIAAASLVSTEPTAAGERHVKLWTTDKQNGGLLTAKITWHPAGKKGLYNGRIEGKYEDTAKDGYCVQGYKTGGIAKVRLGPTACPKGQSVAFNDTYREKKNVAVKVCRKNNKNHQDANCTGWK